MRQRSVPCTVMRGGTSKGLYFLHDALPTELAVRDRVLLAAMGSPDSRQIDGMGGAHPLTSKVAVVGPASRNDADVDYLFLQVVVDRAEVSDAQTCGNILAGVAHFAIDNHIIKSVDGETAVRIHMVNSNSIAVAHVQTPGGEPDYEGDAHIDGVPGTAAPVRLDFEGIAGSNCVALLPTGNRTDVIEGIEVTCIDNGMPVVVIRASDIGKSGRESPADLESDAGLKDRVERIRLAAGPLMNLGDVTNKTVPKVSLVSRPVSGGVIATQTFIPHRVHESIGVLGAASVAAACALPRTVADGIADIARGHTGAMDIEHPAGFLTIGIEPGNSGDTPAVGRTSLLRTARKLMSGEVFIPASIWAPANTH